MRIITDDEIKRMTKEELISEHNYQVFKLQDITGKAIENRMWVGLSIGIIVGIIIGILI